MRLCDTFYTRAISTWLDIANGERMNLIPSEESITDYHLLEIQRSHPLEVRSHRFTKWRESRTSGADWEWWIGGQFRWIGLRFQAKKIDFGRQVFPGLPRTSWHKRQVDRLIESSEKDGVAPWYCFYASRDEVAAPFECRCGAVLSSTFARGCSVHPATYVRRLIDAGNEHFDEVIPGSVPWSCLFCCPRWGDGEVRLVDRVRSFLIAGFGDDQADLPLTVETPPEYVRALIQRDPELDLSRFSPPRHISHVLVITDGRALS